MDMKANMGSFAAALKTKDVWVMNIVSEEGPNTLKLVYDRGLIGSIHDWYVMEVHWVYFYTYIYTSFSSIHKNPHSFLRALKVFLFFFVLSQSISHWFNRCEAYSTYPRTYDLLHAWTVFSDIEKKGCSGEDLLIEMDRILRPTGFIIIRDKQHVIDFVKKYLTALHWEAVTTVDASTELDQDGDEVVFVVQKKLWLTAESLRNTE